MKKLFRQDRIFDIETNGKQHNISFEPSAGKYSLFVDGEYRETFKAASMLSSLFGDLNDYDFAIDGVPVVLAVRFGRMRIAIDGKYTDTGEDFRPVLPLPWWAAIFAVLIMLPPILFKATFFDYIIAVCFVYTCSHYIIKNPDFKITMKKRVIWCIIVTLISWAFFGIFLMLMVRRGY